VIGLKARVVVRERGVGLGDRGGSGWMCREDLVKLIRVQESRAEKHAQLGDENFNKWARAAGLSRGKVCRQKVQFDILHSPFSAGVE
jgi:hypothetical protein